LVAELDAGDLARLAERAPVPLGIALARADSWQLNQAARRLLGADSDGLPGVLGALEPEDARRVAGLFAGAGNRRAVCHTRARPQRTIQLELHPLGEGLAGWMMTFADVSELADDRDWLTVQVQELKHRIRNLFAVVAGLARMGQSGTEESDAGELANRVQALSVAQAALDQPGGMPIDRLCRAVLEPYWVSGRIDIMMHCSAIFLPGDKATPMALALNELATNAVKHGALARPEGRLKIVIEPTADGVRLDWTETAAGRPRPLAGGFGTRLLATSIERQLGGRMERHWGSNELMTRIELPLDGAGTLSLRAG
jgi:two-component sensor histidine kinase